MTTTITRTPLREQAIPAVRQRVRNAGVVFRRTLRDSRKSTFFWALGLAAMALLIAAIFPSIEGLEELNQLFSSPFFQAFAAGMGADMNEIDYTSPEGFIGLEFFSWMPLALAIFAVLFGVSVFAGEEENGILDVLMSTPIPRWQIVVEKCLVLLLNTAILVLVTFLGFVAALAITPGLTLALGNILQATLMFAPITLLLAMLTLFLTTVLRSRMAAGGIAAAVVIGSFFINTVASLAGGVLTQLKALSFFTYYDIVGVLKNGLNWGNVALLLGLAVAFFALSLYCFQRRDLNA